MSSRRPLISHVIEHSSENPEFTDEGADFFVFEEAARKLSEDELEAEAEADIAMWNAAKQSKKAEDWIAYIRRFPNGRFAEMAQMRLARSPATGATPAPDTGPPRIATEAQWSALPAGALYYDPKGNLRRKS